MKKKELIFTKEELVEVAGIEDESTEPTEDQLMKAVDYVDGTLEQEYGDQEDLESHICDLGIHVRGDDPSRKSPKINRRAWEDGWKRTFEA